MARDKIEAMRLWCWAIWITVQILVIAICAFTLFEVQENQAVLRAAIERRDAQIDRLQDEVSSMNRKQRLDFPPN